MHARLDRLHEVNRSLPTQSSAGSSILSCCLGVCECSTGPGQEAQCSRLLASPSWIAIGHQRLARGKYL